MDLLDEHAACAARGEVMAHIEICPVCQAEWALFSRLGADLYAEGEALKAQIPAVDLVDAVMSGLCDLKNGICALSELETPSTVDLEAADAFGAVEGSLDEVGYARWRRRTEMNPELAVETGELRSLHAELEARGAEYRETLPEIDILQPVLNRVAALRTSKIPELAFSADLEAFLDDALDAEGLRRVERAAASDDSFRRELESLKQVKSGLEAAGAAARARTPKIDIVNEVLGALNTSKPVHRATRRLDHPATHRRYARDRWQWAGLTTVAALLLAAFAGLVWSRLPQQNEPDALRMAKPAPATSNSAPGVFKAVEPVTPVLVMESEAGNPGEHPQPPKGITLQEAINMRHAAMLNDADALMRLGQWATLAPAEARALLEDAGLSPEAIVGATQFLPPDEAAAILRAAVQNNPEDPYLRYALAKNSAEVPALQEEAHEQLSAWGELDPENGMPHFMDANLMLAEGKVDEAVSCLQDASTRSSASNYALVTARYHQEALIASGMDPEVARLLAASTAGINESQDVTDLGNQLLAYGRQYESEGDYETAAMFYNAVQSMGMQVDASAVMANERMAGLQTALQAVEALEQIYQVLQTPDSQQVLAALNASLAEGLNGLNEVMTQVTGLFGATDTHVVNQLVNMVLTGGDISLVP
jgi:tetratricopeptide (TPR) repeat protein